MRFSRRGRLASVVVGGLAAALMSPVAAPAGAVPVVTAERAATTQQVVSKNEFGKMRSGVEGTFTKPGTNATGTVSGTFLPRRFFVNDAGEMIAAGVVKLTATRANGNVIGTDRDRVRMPVAEMGGVPVAGARAAAAAVECDVLNLVLGPLDLNLLGLEISLNQVVLDIVAVTGAGNLLGNLLCAVVGLLDGGIPGLLGEIANILNAILAILRL